MSLDAFGIVGTVQAGHFEVERAVAEGGFAVVYRALHRAFRAPVALKCLKIPGAMTAEQRESFLEKFRAEAELSFRLSSITPNVVRPLQVGTLDLPGRFVPFLALEWLEGESLDAVRERRAAAGKPPMSIHKLVKALAPVAKALSIAHHLPSPEGHVAVIHCDLKPENLYVARTATGDTMKILDFGIARVKDATSAIAGRTSGSGGGAAFTPGYGAPEQWDPEQFGQTGPWTDVWGLAITMVELLLGKPAIEGALGTMMSITVDPNRRPTPRTLGLTVSDRIENAMLEALRVDPKARTQDIRTFWSELESAIGLPPSLVVQDPRAEPMRSDPPPSLRRVPSLPPLGPASFEPAPSTQNHEARAQPGSILAELDSGAPAQRVPSPLPPRDDDEDLARGFVLQQQPLRPRPPPAVARYHVGIQRNDEGEGIFDKLAGPLKLVGLALVIAIADQIHTHQTGSFLTLGPARPFWASAGLVGVAVVIAFVRLMRD